MPRLKQIGIDVDVHRAIEQARMSFAESENEILRRLLQHARPPASRQAPARANPSAGQPRSQGLWAVEFRGEKIAARSLKHAYRIALEQLAARFPDFLEGFAREKGRSRRYVARAPRQLYVNAPHLADKFAEPIGDDWFVDTNLSTAQVATRVRAAARLCGLHYGKDLRLLDNMKEI